MMRRVVFDTETTGLEASEGHKIIEIGAVELIDNRLTGKVYHQYINPKRSIDEEAQAVHGIDLEMLADKPEFHEVVGGFIDFIKGAEIVAHNAPFDEGFINAELARLGPSWGRVADYCEVVDTLRIAKRLHPGQRNTLDALCKRYGVDNSQRDYHGALIDSEILADVYIEMLSRMSSLSLESDTSSSVSHINRLDANRPQLRVIKATADDLRRHSESLERLQKSSEGKCAWLMVDDQCSPGI